MLWAIVAVSALCLAAMLYPETVREFIASVLLMVQRPFLVLQTNLAAAANRLREVTNPIFSEIGTLRRGVGALLHLVVFIVLAACGLFLTLLTIAGVFGMTLSWSPPMDLELLSGIAFTIALSFLFAVTLEMLGLHHFGLWESFPHRIKPLLLFALVGLILLGIALIWWMGVARWEAMQISDSQLLQVTSDEEAEAKELGELLQRLSASSEEEETLHRRLMVGLPIFIDGTTAVAFCGAIPGVLVLKGCLLWLLALLLQIVNIPVTVVVQVIETAYGAFNAIINFFGDLGRWLGWPPSGDASAAPAQRPTAPPAPPELPSPTLPTNSGNPSVDEAAPSAPVPSEPPSPTPSQEFERGWSQDPSSLDEGEDVPEPALTPIGTTALDPLGLGLDGQENDALGGAQR